MKVDLITEGIGETRYALGEFKDQYPRELESELNASGQPLKEAQQHYPPEIASSDYVRTFAYRQSVSVQVKLEGAAVTLIDTADPVQHWLRGDVDGSYLGAWMHRGRWTTMKTLMETYIPLIARRLENRLYALARRLGFNG